VIEHVNSIKLFIILTAGTQLLSMTLIVILNKQPIKIPYSAYDNTYTIKKIIFLTKTLVLDISLLSFTLREIKLQPIIVYLSLLFFFADNIFPEIKENIKRLVISCLML
jgi:hypothetical protein